MRKDHNEQRRSEPDIDLVNDGNAPTYSAPSADSRLIAALANYFGSARDKAGVRRAINAWRHDVVHTADEPERLLIQFKYILLGVTLAQESRTFDERMADRREVIRMCIEEYFSAEQQPA